MIKYMRHEEIDPVAWERNLSACVNSSWYGSYNTLDATAPGWDALVDSESGACMPLAHRSKFGIHYLFQPILVQHCGPFSPVQDAGEVQRFLQAIPGHIRYADICVQTASLPPLAQFRTERRINHMLRLNKPVDELRAGYSENHRRSLRKAEQLGVQVQTCRESRDVIALLEGSDQFKRWRVDSAGRLAMRRAMRGTETAGTGFGLMVRQGGSPVAGAWFVRYQDRIIFLKGVGTPKGRELRAMHALIHQVVADHAGEDIILDLAGGNDPQLARFYGGFGAEQVVYLRALMNRLPAIVRWLKP